MAKVASFAAGIELATTLGLDPKLVHSITLKAKPEGALEVDVTLFVTGHQFGAIIANLKRYKLVPLDDDGKDAYEQWHVWKSGEEVSDG